MASPAQRTTALCRLYRHSVVRRTDWCRRSGEVCAAVHRRSRRRCLRCTPTCCVASCTELETRGCPTSTHCVTHSVVIAIITIFIISSSSGGSSGGGKCSRTICGFKCGEWLGSRVVSVLDSGAEGPVFKSQPRCCRVTVLGKLFTPIVPLFTKQQNW